MKSIVNCLFVYIAGKSERRLCLVNTENKQCQCKETGRCKRTTIVINEERNIYIRPVRTVKKRKWLPAQIAQLIAYRFRNISYFYKNSNNKKCKCKKSIQILYVNDKYKRVSFTFQSEKF